MRQREREVQESDVSIEPLHERDIAEVCSLLGACFGWLAEQEGFTDREREFLTGERSSEQTVREESRRLPHWVARRDGVIAGVVAVRENRITRLYVHPQFHRQGVGRVLYEQAERAIREAGFTEVTVGALVESAAAFYRSMGMIETGRTVYEPEIFVGRSVSLLTKPLGT